MYKVLIVDDENLVRVAFRTMVDYEAYGFSICGTAADGEEALRICARETPDLIITDIKMPRMDGIELIERLKEQNYDGKIILISNYDDFSLVRRGMVLGAQDYLLKLTITEQEYADMLLRMKRELDESACRRQQHELARSVMLQMERERRADFWRRLLLAPVVDQKDLPDGLFGEGALNLFLVQVVRYGQVMKISSQKDMELLNYALLNVAAELLGPDVLCQGAIGDGRYFVITGCRGAERMQQEFLARQLNAALTKYLNITVGVFFQPAVADEETLLALLDSRRQMADKLFYAQSSVPVPLLPAREFGSWNCNIPRLTEELCKALCRGDADGALEQIDSRLRLCREGFVSRSEALHKWATVLLLLYERMEGFLPGGAPCVGPEQVYRADTEEQLRELLHGAIRETLRQMRSEAGSAGAAEVEKVLRYIHAHLGERITLSQLARHAGFNETYLCTVFRARTGTSIVNYINRTKMERAAERLSGGDALLKTVAAELGFSDQFYFNKMFRKYYGMSPSEYRKRQQNITNAE